MIVTFERDIKNELIVLEKKIQEHLKESFDKKKGKNDVFITTLSHISDILFKTSLKHEEWHHFAENNEDKQFAFFPGYVDNNGDRIFHIGFLNKNKYKNNGEISFDTTYNENENDRFNYDFWYNKDRHNSLTYKNELKKSDEVSLLSLAYHFLFFGKKEKTNATFSSEVGGTHQWASKVADEIAINDALDPLTLLAFYDNKKDARDNQLKYKSWINIPFDLKGVENVEVVNAKSDNDKIKLIQKEIFEWCESVVNKLYFPSNSKDINQINERWPYNPGDQDEFNNDKYILIYRAYIVAFWMQLVLNPDRMFNIKNRKLLFTQKQKKISTNHKKKLEFDAWFNFTDYYSEYIKQHTDDTEIQYGTFEELFNCRKSRISYLKKVIENKNNDIIVHNYRYWYTIPFEHRLDFSSDNGKEDRKETGSAMILSNYLLDGEYFRFVIPWLNQMYNSMREYDTAKGAANKALHDLYKDIIKNKRTIADVKEWLKSLNEDIEDNDM